MPFENYLDPTEKAEPLSSLYRFAEIEIYQTIDIMKPLIEPSILFSSIANALHLPPDLHLEWRFNNPTKQELVRYLRYFGVPYRTTQQIAGVSLSYIYELRFDYEPLWPVYLDWQPYQLQLWDRYRNLTNNHLDPLARTKKKRNLYKKDENAIDLY